MTSLFPSCSLPILQAETVDFIAKVQISQSYYNDSDSALETVYHFPIYNGATVCGFEAEYEDGRCIKGRGKDTVADSHDAMEEVKQDW